MKKFKVLLTCVLSISMICGCSQLSAPESTTSAPTSAPATTQASQASDQPEASEAPGPELEPITFKVGFISSQAATDEAHNLMCDEIERLSGGAIKIERYLQGQLYTADSDGSIALSEGTLDMVIMGDLMVSAAAPEIAGFTQIPFAFDSKEQCEEFWKTVADQCNEKMLEKYGCRILFDHLAMRGPRVVAANRPLIKAEDYKGLKMRLPSIAASVASFEALGVSPMTSSMGELYQVLQTGTAQACESPISTLDSIAIYEVCDYAMLTDHTYSFRAAHVNEKWWSSLSPAHQEIIQQGIKVGFDRFNELESNGDEAILQKWRDNGMTVIENSEIDTQSIKDVVTPVILEKYKDEWDMSIGDVIQPLR